MDVLLELFAKKRKKFRARSCGGPAPGARRVIGGSRMRGHGMSGTSLCKQRLASLSTVSFMTCSADAGLWKERMTETVLCRQSSVIKFSFWVSGVRRRSTTETRRHEEIKSIFKIYPTIADC